MADTYALVRRLRDVGFPEAQAAEIVEVSKQTQIDFVTKEFLTASLESLKSELLWKIVTIFVSIIVASISAVFFVARYVH